AAVDTGSRYQPSGGLTTQIRPLPLGVGPSRPERRPHPVDHTRIPLGKNFITQAPRFHRSGPKVCDHNVCLLGQTEEHFGSSRLSQVDGYTALPSITGDEISGAFVVRRRRQRTTLVADPGKLD